MFIFNWNTILAALILGLFSFIARNVIQDRKNEKINDVFIWLAGLAQSIRERKRELSAISAILRLREIHDHCLIPTTLTCHPSRMTALEEVLYFIKNDCSITAPDLDLLSMMLKWDELLEDNGQEARTIILWTLSDHMNIKLLPVVIEHGEFLKKTIKKCKDKSSNLYHGLVEEEVLIEDMIKRCQ